MKTAVSLVRTTDRASGIRKAIDLLAANPVQGKSVLLKPNFNSADPFPGSTHIDTLRHLILCLKDLGAREVTVGDRSGPPDTADVIRDLKVDSLCRELKAGLVNFEELPPDGWALMNPPGSHWRKGFYVARPVIEAERVVSTCCLKTHAFGGVFTMSLKLSVGITHKKNMTELHTSVRSMRKMIAEINHVYKPCLILLDGIEAFVDGGPMNGKRSSTGVLLAATDRIAMDAVGLAVLKQAGSNRAIMGKKIFDQEQISRAVELGLGIAGPQEIDIVTGDEESEGYATKVREILGEG